jgi:hypothetical protein
MLLLNSALANRQKKPGSREMRRQERDHCHLQFKETKQLIVTSWEELPLLVMVVTGTKSIQPMNRFSELSG